MPDVDPMVAADSLGASTSVEAQSTETGRTAEGDSALTTVSSQPPDGGPVEFLKETIGHPLVVAVVAIFIGRAVQVYFQRRKRKRDYRALLRVVLEEIDRNIGLLVQIDAYLYVGIIPSFSLSLLAPTHVFRELLLAADDYGRISTVFDVYFEYQHIEDRLGQVSDLMRERMISTGEGRSHSVSRSGDDPLPGLMEATRGLVRGAIVKSRKSHDVIAVESKRPTLPREHLSTLLERIKGVPEVKRAAELSGRRLEELAAYE